jgi:hypothetical protein
VAPHDVKEIAQLWRQDKEHEAQSPKSTP